MGAAAAGASLTVVNPKVVLMCAAAGFAIGTAGLSTLGTTAAVSYFTLLAGSTAAVPILAYLVWSHRVDRLLERFATGRSVVGRHHRRRSPDTRRGPAVQRDSRAVNEMLAR